MRFDQMAVRFLSVPGVVDSEWLQIGPGVSILTGRNNVGKSRLLRAINDLRALQGEAASPKRDAPNIKVQRGTSVAEADLRTFDRPVTLRLFDGNNLIYETEWNQSGPDQWHMGNTGYGKRPALTTLGIEAALIREGINTLVYFPPQRVVAAETETHLDLNPTPDASNLAKVLYSHHGRHSPEFDLISKTIQDMLPEIDRILAEPTADNLITLKLHDRYAGENIRLDETGTGVAQLLHLVTSIVLLPAGSTLLIEEPDTFLHPGAQRVLARFIREHPEHSYVISSHSPVFVDALGPDRIWLAQRHEASGTSIAPVMKEGALATHALVELGINRSDLAMTERILFVEGATDVKIYPVLLNKLGWDLDSLACTVVALGGAGAAPPVQQVMEALGQSVRIRHMICLDQDQKVAGVVAPSLKFLPVGEVEDLLLRDPSAVRKVFRKIIADEMPAALSEWDRTWTAINVSEFINRRRGDVVGIKGSKVLIDLANEMGFHYRKPHHGPAIAAEIDPGVIQDLLPLFGGLFTDG